MSPYLDIRRRTSASVPVISRSHWRERVAVRSRCECCQHTKVVAIDKSSNSQGLAFNNRCQVVELNEKRLLRVTVANILLIVSYTKKLHPFLFEYNNWTVRSSLKNYLSQEGLVQLDPLGTMSGGLLTGPPAPHSMGFSPIALVVFCENFALSSIINQDRCLLIDILSQ